MKRKIKDSNDFFGYLISIKNKDNNVVLGRIDIVNIGLHFFLKDVRPMLPPVMNRSIVDA